MFQLSGQSADRHQLHKLEFGALLDRRVASPVDRRHSGTVNDGLHPCQQPLLWEWKCAVQPAQEVWYDCAGWLRWRIHLPEDQWGWNGVLSLSRRGAWADQRRHHEENEEVHSCEWPKVRLGQTQDDAVRRRVKVRKISELLFIFNI